MLRAGMTKSEIEKTLEGKGDYVQLDYLFRFLKNQPSLDMKKFIYLKLAETHKRMNMFRDAGINYSHAANISITFKDKINYFVKSVECYIQSGDFGKADESMKKALAEANTAEKKEIYLGVKKFYKEQAEFYEKKMKIGQAIKIYNKLLEMKLDDFERETFNIKLESIKEKFGGKIL